MFVVIGTTTVDLLISGFNKTPAAEGDEFTAGSLVFCDNPLTMTLGGNGANSAYVFASLGTEVSLISAIGNDPLADLVVSWLTERGVRIGNVLHTPDAATATTTALTDHHLNRTSYHHAGASRIIEPEHVPLDVIQQANIVLITGYSLLPGFHHGGFEPILSTARNAQAITALDIGPAVEPVATLKEIAELLPLVDYLLTNEYELQVCTGTDTMEEGVQVLRSHGVGHIIVKLGKAGAVAFGDGEPVKVSGYPVNVTATVGAGDSFNAGLFFALQNGVPLVEAIRYANATASLVLRSNRGVLGSPSNEHVCTFINQNQ